MFAPYEYLIDPILRASSRVKIKDSIVVFDEGHNILQAAEAVMSFEFKLDDFQAMMNNLDHLIGWLEIE